MKVPVVATGGTNVKLLTTGRMEPRRSPFRARHDARTDGCRGQETGGELEV